MILFPGISSKVMLRALIPYIFSVIAILAVVTGYIHFTDDIYFRAIQLEQKQAIQTAGSIARIAVSEEMSPVIFNSYQSAGSVYFELKPEFLRSFNLSYFTMDYPISGETPEDIPFDEDSLAARAMSSGLPAMRYIEGNSQTTLLLFYPFPDLDGNSTIAEMVFENVLGEDALNSGRYGIYIISLAVILLIIIPGLFIKLAVIRRKIEMSDFYQGNIETETDDYAMNSDIYPSSFLDGFEFPALFRLDSTGTMVSMNDPAEKLIDISKNDMKGVKFHELPCFSPEIINLIIYPESDDPEEYILDILDSSGNSRKSSFRIQMLNNGKGYAVTARNIPDGDGQVLETGISGAPAGMNEKPSENMLHNDIQRIITILDKCRTDLSEDSACFDKLGIISGILTGKGSYKDKDFKEKTGFIEIFSELNAISEALNDVLPERASIELDVPGFLPQVECSREDFTQIVKNMVFYSLESTNGPVRMKLGARDVPSPVSDSVFSTNCDRTILRSVSLSYTGGGRMPVVLKEALLDPETDLSGIQRDFGSHISSVAAVLSKHDCHPVFTEGVTGTTLNILFRIREDYLFDVSHTEPLHSIDLSKIKLAICDASRIVRESVGDVLTQYGIGVRHEADLEKMMDGLAESSVDYLVLDYSAVEEPMETVLSNVRTEFPDLEIILTAGSSEINNSVRELLERKGRILLKPYSVDELLNIIEISVSSGLNNENTG